MIKNDRLRWFAHVKCMDAAGQMKFDRVNILEDILTRVFFVE